MKLKVFAAFAATIMLAASCGTLGSSASSASSKNTVGSRIGAALAGLYTQYKTDGKIDLGNLANIINIAQILTDLKGATNTANGLLQNSEFLTGLISGSQNLVNQNNSGSIVNNLATLAGLDLSAFTKAANKAAAGSEQAAQQAVTQVSASPEQIAAAVTSLSNIFKAFK